MTGILVPAWLGFGWPHVPDGIPIFLGPLSGVSGGYECVSMLDGSGLE